MGQIPQNFEQLVLIVGTQALIRFIQTQQVPVRHQFNTHIHPGLLASAELAVPILSDTFHAQHVQGSIDTLLNFPIRCIARKAFARRQPELLLRGEGFVEHLLLGNIADHLLHAVKILHQVHIPVKNAALHPCQVHTVQAVHHGGFARARRAQHGNQGAAADVDIDIADQLLCSRTAEILHPFSSDLRVKDHRALRRRCQHHGMHGFFPAAVKYRLPHKEEFAVRNGNAVLFSDERRPGHSVVVEIGTRLAVAVGDRPAGGCIGQNGMSAGNIGHRNPDVAFGGPADRHGGLSRQGIPLPGAGADRLGIEEQHRIRMRSFGICIVDPKDVSIHQSDAHRFVAPARSWQNAAFIKRSVGILRIVGIVPVTPLIAEQPAVLCAYNGRGNLNHSAAGL